MIVVVLEADQLSVEERVLGVSVAEHFHDMQDSARAFERLS
jgi:hypothetical protein